MSKRAEVADETGAGHQDSATADEIEAGGRGNHHPGRGPPGPLPRRPQLGGLRARGHPRGAGHGRGRRPGHLIDADHHRHRRPAGPPGRLLPPGHRRLSRRRRRLRRPETTSGPGSQNLAGAALVVDYVLDRGRLDRRRCRRRSPPPSRRSRPHSLPHRPRRSWPCITALNLRGIGHERPGLPASRPPCSSWASRRHRRRPRPPRWPRHSPQPGVPRATPRRRWSCCSSSRPSRPGAAPSPASKPSPTTCRLFKEPRVRRAKRTEMLLGVILGTMLLGLAVLSVRFHVVPRSSQTVLSQIMAAAVGRHGAYLLSCRLCRPPSSSAMAANTSFGGLPVLGSLLARDNCVPHVFGLRDDRLVYRYGVGGPGRRWPAALMIAVRRQHQLPDPIVRHRGVHRVHPLPDRHGRALARHRPPAGGRGRPSTRRGGDHRRRHRRLPR